MTITESVPDLPGEIPAGGSGFRTNRVEIARFDHPLTRMLLASDGFTMPVLEAILGTELEVRVLRQDELSAERLPAVVSDALRSSGNDHVIVRRSCLMDPDMRTVSVNHVVTVSEPAAASGVDDIRMPIGYSLMARGVSQRRSILRVGLARWPDGRACAAKSYVIVLGDRPLCYIRESFNPSVIPPDHSYTDGGDPHWGDEPETSDPGPTDLATALPAAGHETSQYQPPWPDTAALRTTVERLRGLPPLVHPDECSSLTADLAEAVHGRAFVLHLGDCAETFAMCDTGALAARRALMHAAASVLAHGLGLPIVSIGRLAGQYAKPRSTPVEPGTGLMSYYGDMVNGHERDPAVRTPDPNRLLDAYFHAAATLNYLRRCAAPPTTLCAKILVEAADRCVEPVPRELLRAVAGLLSTAAVAPARSRELYSSISRLHVSHEALILPYEAALTRRGSDRRWWDCSTQLLWIGDRTRNPAQGHVRFAAEVHNPVAVKLGPAATPRDVESLCARLNPENRPGRLTLIPRLGAERAVDGLPALFDAAAAVGSPVCWICDPMHANTRMYRGQKIRRVDDIVAEIRAFFQACRATGTVPGGLHLECAPEAVSECVGGWGARQSDDSVAEHRTRCDPRLNPVQTLHCVVAALTELRGLSRKSLPAKELDVATTLPNSVHRQVLDA
ncbi:3-deoxy-7-phosphoheptulonate synthase [Nocardia pseudobrasiliensis]|uniref:Phospho-2-dehydro-3-deoxyheptonate aldolase n=1 Tax=Nocardia pseudobrasiliensis TaxID=45979 RepID=A0A370HPN3_9NOCA|nr:3-deoxy-7-phosphoheptulonate synthase [Nocardia pseudobrasiliensis]RDI60290.1 3-deoxy-D-arabinoheptulosonate-7-phosphate synthase [Nocardia pseudobrasiliensis]